MNNEKEDRYQNQPFYIKALRWLIHYPQIPFRAVYNWIFYRKELDMTFEEIVSLETGLAQGRMNWIYSWEEAVIKFS